VLAAIRDRVGGNVTDLLTEYLEDVKSAATDDLMSRIRQAADPDVIHAIAALAGDVPTEADGKRLLLSLTVARQRQQLQVDPYCALDAGALRVVVR
jgi:hypothetical protein